MNVIAGNFTYPPPNSNLQYNYKDSVVTSWVTADPDTTQAILSLWYWLLNGQIHWTLSILEIVLANGSKPISLQLSGVDSDFLAQFNINYQTKDDGSPQKFVSPIFNVAIDNNNVGGSSESITWNQQALSTTVSSAFKSPTTSTSQAATPITTTAALQTSSPEATNRTSAQPSSASSSSSSSSSSSHHLDAAIGASIAVPLSIAAISLVGFLFWKTRKRERGRSHEKSYEASRMKLTTAVVDEGLSAGELEARHRRYPELAVGGGGGGRSDAELDGHGPMPLAVAFR